MEPSHCGELSVAINAHAELHLECILILCVPSSMSMVLQAAVYVH